MIHADDILVQLFKDHGWEVSEVFDIGRLHTMFCISRGGGIYTKLNVMVQNHNVSILNVLKERDYVEAKVSLFDPTSLDQLVNILK